MTTPYLRPQAEACPACGSTTGVQPITDTSPKVQAWRCLDCDTSWAITTVRPQQPAYFERLCAAVARTKDARQGVGLPGPVKIGTPLPTVCAVVVRV